MVSPRVDLSFQRRPKCKKCITRYLNLIWHVSLQHMPLSLTQLWWCPCPTWLQRAALLAFQYTGHHRCAIKSYAFWDHKSLLFRLAPYTMTTIFVLATKTVSHAVGTSRASLVGELTKSIIKASVLVPLPPWQVLHHHHPPRCVGRHSSPWWPDIIRHQGALVLALTLYVMTTSVFLVDTSTAVRRALLIGDLMDLGH